MRTATISRNTNETQIELSLNLDDYSKIQIDTGIGFFNHMLDARPLRVGGQSQRRFRC